MSSVEKKRSRSRSPTKKTRKSRIDISDVRRELSEDSRPVKIYKMERLINVLSYVAVFFLALYVTAGVFDDLYKEQYEVTKSNIFISNVIAISLLAALLLIRHYNPGDTTGLFVTQIMMAAGIAAAVIVSSYYMKDLLEDTDTVSSTEDTTQYILSLLGIIFSGLCALLIMVNVIMARYG